MPTLCLWNAASTMARPANRGNSRLDHQILARGPSAFGGAPIEMDFDLMQVHQGWWRQHSRSLPKEHNYHNDHRLLWQLNKPSQAPEEAERQGTSLPAPADGRESTSQNAQVRVSQCVLQRICRPAALPMRLPLGEAKGICKSKASAGTQASFENEKRKARLRKAKLRMDVAYSRMPLCKSVDAHIRKRKVVFPKTISVRSVQRRAISPFSNSVGTSNRPYMAGKPNRRSVRPSSHR